MLELALWSNPLPEAHRSKFIVSTRKKYESSRQLERQAHILATARQMLAELGYNGMTMRNLAERAGVVPATLYNLYGGKDELMLAALDGQLRQLWVEALDDAEEGVDAILGVAIVSGRHSEETPSYAAALARSLHNIDRDHPAVDGLYARSLPYFLHHLNVAQTQGQLEGSTDIEVVAKHLVGQGWSVIWSWMMGLVERSDICREYERSYLMTLISVADGETLERLRRRLTDLNQPKRKNDS